MNDIISERGQPNPPALLQLSEPLFCAPSVSPATLAQNIQNLNMRLLLAVTPVLASLQAVLSAPGPYVPVPYTQAPSYYPGAPWSFPEPQSGRRVCTVVAPEDGSDSAPNIVKAFKDCSRDSKVIFEDTTCMCPNAFFVDSDSSY